jgi:very-short-patch-repair endonuclease
VSVLRLTEEELLKLAKRLGARRVRMEEETPIASHVKLTSNPPVRSPKGKRGPRTDYEGILALQIKMAGLPAPEREYKFAAAEGRKFRADLAFPDKMLLIEIDGAVHRIKGRFDRDLEKGQIALRLGWRVLHTSPVQVKNGRALQLVEAALKGGLPAV